MLKQTENSLEPQLKLARSRKPTANKNYHTSTDPQKQTPAGVSLPTKNMLCLLLVRVPSKLARSESKMSME